MTTKDRWTINLKLSLNVQKNSYVGLRDDNFIGMGHEMEATISRDNNPVAGWGYQLRYTANNVAATFVNITASLEANNRSSVKIIDLSRPFISQKIRFAGGLSFQRTDDKLFFINQDSSSLLPFSNNTIDMWTGYSLSLIHI